MKIENISQVEKKISGTLLKEAGKREKKNV